MDIRTALKEQYHAGLAMLRQCVEVCPDDMWTAGAPPRTFFRIVFHTAFFTHLYLGQSEAAFEPWPGRRPEWHPRLWEDPAYMEPYELPENAESYDRREMLEYIAHVDSLIDPTVDALNLDTEDSGFYWYKDITKLSHQLMNIRHVQGHVGQLSELLMTRGIDIDWVAKKALGR
jgi:hypothetical protein